MDARTYQHEAARTLISNADVPAFPPRDVAVAWGLVEMARRLGFEIDDVKKEVFHQHGYDATAQGRTIDRTQSLRYLADGVADLLDGIGADVSHIDAAGGLRPFDVRLLWNTMGVLGEGAEIANVVLTQLESGDLDRAALGKEIGDLCWYLAALCTMVDLDFGDVLTANIEKLHRRYPDGWKAKDSQQRDLVREGGGGL